MLYYIKLYVVSLVAFFLIDILWLGFIAKGFYQKHLGYVLASDPNWPAAILFYLLFVLGVVVFVIAPGINESSFIKLLPKAAFFGLITYATYDLTNLATLKDWPVIVTVVDIMWGTVLSTVVSFAGFTVGKLLA